jgi:hypothetical protein
VTTITPDSRAGKNVVRTRLSTSGSRRLPLPRSWRDSAPTSKSNLPIVQCTAPKALKARASEQEPTW